MSLQHFLGDLGILPTLLAGRDHLLVLPSLLRRLFLPGWSKAGRIARCWSRTNPLNFCFCRSHWQGRLSSP